MHGDGSDCGRQILIYGTPAVSDGQPAVSGQEVCACLEAHIICVRP